MALTLLSSPSRTQDAIESGLSAANSQAPFEFERKDYDECDVRNDDLNIGFVKFNIPASYGDVTADFPIGATFTYYGATPSSLNATYTVRVSDHTSNTNVRCEEVFTAISTVDGYILLHDRLNYHVLIELMAPDNSAPLTDELFVYVPRQDGYLFFDFGPLLAGAMDSQDSQLFSYSIRYSEFFSGTQGATSVLPKPLDAVRGRRQIGKVLGANLWNWILKPLTSGVYGRVFTDFHEPKICRQHTRTLDILFDSLLSERVNPLNSITIKKEGLNINKVVDGAISTETILPTTWYDTPQMYAINMNIAAGLPAFANSEYIKLSVLDGVIDLVEPLICKIVEPCTQHAIMLQWLNDVGGVEQWVFGYNQPVNEGVNIGEIMEFPVTQDFSTVRNTKGRLIQGETQHISLTAENLKENEIRALKYIKSSPSLKVELAGNFYNVVVVSPFDTMWETANSLHTFVVTIEMPVDFDYFEQVPL